MGSLHLETARIAIGKVVGIVQLATAAIPELGIVVENGEVVDTAQQRRVGLLRCLNSGKRERILAFCQEIVGIQGIGILSVRPECGVGAQRALGEEYDGAVLTANQGYFAQIVGRAVGRGEVPCFLDDTSAVAVQLDLLGLAESQFAQLRG